MKKKLPDVGSLWKAFQGMFIVLLCDPTRFDDGGAVDVFWLNTPAHYPCRGFDWLALEFVRDSGHCQQVS